MTRTARRRTGGIAMLVLVVSGAGCRLIGETSVAAHPSRVGPPPGDLHARSVRVSSEAGPPLAGWYLPAAAGAPAVVLLHGVTDSRRTMIPRARLLRDAGFAVLAVDGRGHGESPRARVTYGARERLDAEAAVAYVRRRRPGTRVGVVGISLGGAGAALAAERLGADAVVLESVFATLDEATANRLRRWAGPLREPLRASLARQAPRLLGAPADSVAPVRAVGRLGAPVLVAGGARDPFTPPAETRRLWAAARAPRRLWIVPGARHEDLFAADPDGYRAHVLAFLVETLRPAGSPVQPPPSARR